MVWGYGLESCGSGYGLVVDCWHYLTFGFHKRHVISWPAEQILASEEGFCFMKLIIMMGGKGMAGILNLQVDMTSTFRVLLMLIPLSHIWLFFRFFRCAKCKSKFSSPESLDHHMAISTHSYPCPHCGKVFACERYLRRHLPTHGTAQSFTCQQCGKGFRTEQYLNTHLLTHSAHKPHVCQVWTNSLVRGFNRNDVPQKHKFEELHARR
jgi:DNA-directed RNA polymerase subunit RPC12/RpoP